MLTDEDIASASTEIDISNIMNGKKMPVIKIRLSFRRKNMYIKIIQLWFTMLRTFFESVLLTSSYIGWCSNQDSKGPEVQKKRPINHPKKSGRLSDPTKKWPILSASFFWGHLVEGAGTRWEA